MSKMVDGLNEMFPLPYTEEEATDILEQKVLAVLTPENVSLGHTWLKRKVREIFRAHG